MNAALLFASLTIAIGQADPKEPPPDEQQLARTREQMRERWKRSRAFVPLDGERKEVPRRDEPIMTYFERARDGGAGRLGALWIWGPKGRPVAVFVQALNAETRLWGHELVAIAEGVSTEMHDGWEWSPDSALKMTRFKESAAPGATKAARLVQIKKLARRLTMSETFREQQYTMRMLPRPIYRYQDPDAGLIDGAMFNFALGTGPEALAVIECRQTAAGTEWFYGILPLAGAAVTVKLDDEVVWSKPQTTSSRAQEFYSVWLEKDEP